MQYTSRPRGTILGSPYAGFQSWTSEINSVDVAHTQFDNNSSHLVGFFSVRDEFHYDIFRLKLIINFRYILSGIMNISTLNSFSSPIVV